MKLEKHLATELDQGALSPAVEFYAHIIEHRSLTELFANLIQNSFHLEVRQICVPLPNNVEPLRAI